MATAAQDYTGDEGVVAGRGAGWVAFAAVMLGLAGLWNVLEGILAIGQSRVYVNDSTFVFSDLNTWGWIMLCLGALQLFAAFTIVSGSEFGRWLGVGAALLNSIGQLYFMPAYPLWATLMFAVDVLIVYGLIVYGGNKMKGVFD
jgi:hypothetical protein